MIFLYRTIKYFYRYTGKLGICGNSGLITGITAGLLLCFLNIRSGLLLVLTNDEVWKLSLELSLFCWLTILLLLLVFMRLKPSQILTASLFNSLLVCFSTVYIVNKYHLFPIAWLAGMLIGTLIGYLLCQLSKSLNLKK